MSSKSICRYSVSSAKAEHQAPRDPLTILLRRAWNGLCLSSYDDDAVICLSVITSSFIPNAWPRTQTVEQKYYNYNQHDDDDSEYDDDDSDYDDDDSVYDDDVMQWLYNDDDDVDDDDHNDSGSEVQQSQRQLDKGWWAKKWVKINSSRSVWYTCVFLYIIFTDRLCVQNTCYLLVTSICS